MFYFGVGTGCLDPREISRRRRIAKKQGAEFFAITGEAGHCLCGRGCRMGDCPIKKYWFGGPNLGEPFDSALARRVMNEVKATNKKKEPHDPNT